MGNNALLSYNGKAFAMLPAQKRLAGNGVIGQWVRAEGKNLSYITPGFNNIELLGLEKEYRFCPGLSL